MSKPQKVNQGSAAQAQAAAGSSKSAKRRLARKTARQRFEATAVARGQTQAQHLSLSQAYGNLANLASAGVEPEPYAVGLWLRELSYKQLHALLDSALANGLISPADMTDSFINGRPNFRNKTVWNILQAGVLDDFPWLEPIRSTVQKVVSAGMYPNISDAFNMGLMRNADKLIDKIKPSPKRDQEAVSYRQLFGRVSGTVQVRPQRVGNSFSLVNVDAVKSYFCPSLYCSVMGSDDLQPVAALSGSVTYSLSTNANGDLFAYIWPKTCVAGTLVTLYNDATFNPVAGTQTPAGTSLNGQFSSFIDILSTARLVGASVTLSRVSPNLTTSGFVQSFPFAVLPMDGVSITPSGLFPAQPYYNGTALADLHEQTVVRCAIGFEDLAMVNDANSTYTEGFAIMVVGAPANIDVLSITITQTFEYTVTGNYRRLIQTAVPPIAPATRMAIAAVISAQPDLLNSSLTNQVSFTSNLPDGLMEYSDFVDCIQ